MSELSESTEYILDSINVWVRSGFYYPAEVAEMVDDLLEEDSDEKLLKNAINPLFEKIRVEQADWPSTTDCDRLDQAFRELDKKGIRCLHNAGHTMSDGHGDAYDEIARSPEGKYYGYCFYHGQDLERVMNDDGGLFLAFDHIEGDVPDKEKVGQTIHEELVSSQLRVEWDGSTQTRILLPNFDWRRRLP